MQQFTKVNFDKVILGMNNDFIQLSVHLRGGQTSKGIPYLVDHF